MPKRNLEGESRLVTSKLTVGLGGGAFLERNSEAEPQNFINERSHVYFDGKKWKGPGVRIALAFKDEIRRSLRSNKPNSVSKYETHQKNDSILADFRHHCQ
jgi:hypothetical protein